jgi:hypothetical protein
MNAVRARSIPRLRAPEPVIVGVLAAIAIAISSGLRATPYANYTLLADALLHGRAWVVWPGPTIDALPYYGRYYIIEGPVPGLLMLPLVAILGARANQTLLGIVLAGVAVGAAWRLCRRFGLSTAASCWLCLFLLLGTDLWWCAMYGDVWFLAHLGAVAFTLLALVELIARAGPRPWLVALFGACAAGSRFSLVLALPVYAWFLAQRRDPFADGSADRVGAPLAPEIVRRRLLVYCATLVPFALGWVGWNEARWGLPIDIGYTEWYHHDPIGLPAGSPFRLGYVPYELWSFLLQTPIRWPTYPWLVVTNSGVALTWTSPALVFAACARRPRAAVVAVWVATLLVAAPSLVYYANGGSQFGMLHALVFEPFLFVLMVLAARGRGLPRWVMVLCAYSIVVGVWGLWFWRTFYRPNY